MIEQLDFPEAEDVKQVRATRKRSRVKSCGRHIQQAVFPKREASGLLRIRSYF